MRIGVIGAGSWGTTLAKLLAEKSNEVTIWSYTGSACDSINEHNENTQFLPGVVLPADLVATTDIIGASKDKELLLSISP